MVCGPEEPYNITRYRRYLPELRGTDKVNITVSADSGDVCVKATMRIQKK